MNLRQYLIIMSIGAITGWLGWVWILWQLDPLQAGVSGMGLFYITLALAIIGTYTVIGFCVRRLLVKSDQLIFRQVKQTLRHAAFLALFINILLILQTHRWLNWLTLIIVVSTAVLAETAARRATREITYAN